MIDARRAECEQIIHSLLKAQAMRFDTNLSQSLPKTHGLYAISMVGATAGEYLHAGKTHRGISGLRGRVWEQHYKTGGADGDLIEKVRARGHGRDAQEARTFIRLNCQVQWVVVEDEMVRSWAEHYVLALLRPTWCS